MAKNVGGYDRLVRSALGPALILVGGAEAGGLLSFASGPPGLVLAALPLLAGAVLTVTAITRTCPLNSFLGVDTYPAASTRGSRPESTSDVAESGVEHD